MAEGGLLPWRRQRHDGTKYQDFEEMLKPLPPPPEGLMWRKTRVSVEDDGSLVGFEVDLGFPVEGEGKIAAGHRVGNNAADHDRGKNAEVVEVLDGAQGQGVRTRYATRWELVKKTMKAKVADAEEGGGADGGENAVGQEMEEAGLGEDEVEGATAPAFLTHVVLPTDTMAGLRLRYKVTAAELRMFNDFCGEQFHMLQTLQIPLKRDSAGHVLKHRQRPTRAVLRQQFINATRCTDEEEITYYLDAADWRLEAAVAEHREDRVWEAAHLARMEKVISLPNPPVKTAPKPHLTSSVSSGPRLGLEHASIPPPSYASFFRAPPGARQGRRTRKGLWSSWSLSRGGRKAKAVYDMDSFVAEDYVILSGADQEGESGGGEEGSPTGSAALLGQALEAAGKRERAIDEEHALTPLLARAVIRT